MSCQFKWSYSDKSSTTVSPQIVQILLPSNLPLYFRDLFASFSFSPEMKLEKDEIQKKNLKGGEEAKQ